MLHARRKPIPVLLRLRFPTWLKVVIIVVPLLVLVTATAARLLVHSPSTYSGPVERLTTGVIGEYASPIYVAQAQGYFKAAGLDVTLKQYDSGPAALSDLLAGKLDLAMASDFAGVRNSFAGEDLKILANVSRSDAFALVLRTDRGVTRVAQLKGKKIGVTRKTVGEFYLGQYLTFNRLAYSDVTIVDQPQAALVDSLASGAVDAAVLFEPNAYKAKSRLGATADNWPIQTGQSIYSMLYTTGTFTQTKPAVVERYLRALVRAEQYIKANDSRARTIVAQQLGYDSAYLNYVWPKFSFNIALDQELLLNMDDEARWAIENHITNGTHIPNYLHLVYLDALNAIDPSRITIIR